MNLPLPGILQLLFHPDNIGNISLCVGFITELYITELVVSRLYIRKEGFWGRVLLGEVLLAALGMILGNLLYYLPFYDMRLYILNECARYSILYLASIAALRFCFEGGWGQLILCGATGYAVQHLISQIGFIFWPSNLGAQSITLWQQGIMVLLHVAVFAVFWIYFDRNRLRESTAMGDRKIQVLFAMTILLVLFLSVVRDYYLSESVALSVITRIFSITCCLFLFLIRSGFVTESHLEAEMETINQLHRKEQEQYKLSKANVDLINIKSHDLKKRLEQYEDRMIGLTSEEIAEIKESVAIYDTRVQTGNEILDTILTERSLICEQRGIKFSCIADGASLSFLTTGDTYSLFANAVDNAMEAVSKLRDPQKRIISLTIRKKLGMISILVDNYYEQEYVSFQNGLPVTTKEDDTSHGFGMKSIRNIVEKYGGEMHVSADDLFHLSILIPIP